MRRLATLCVVAVLGLAATLAGGCAVVVPGHAESYDLEGERVSVQMLTWDELKSTHVGDLQGDWTCAFNPRTWASDVKEVADADLQKPPFAGMAPMVPGAAAVVGAVVDFASKQLADEAERYEAQFSARVADDGFWRRVKPGDSTSGWSQRYAAIEVVRKTASHGSDAAPSFRMVFGLCPSRDQKALLIAPIYLKCESAKAKVLEPRWWSALPPFFAWHFFLEAGDTVDQEIEVELEAAWMRSDDFIQRQTAVVPLKLGQYSLTKKPVLRAADGSIDAVVSGWFGTVPISTGAVGDVAGTFKVAARVTQRDPSNAKKYLEKGAELLTENRERLVSRVK